jgi:hypothetical protein
MAHHRCRNGPGSSASSGSYRTGESKAGDAAPTDGFLGRVQPTTPAARATIATKAIIETFQRVARSLCARAPA